MREIRPGSRRSGARSYDDRTAASRGDELSERGGRRTTRSARMTNAGRRAFPPDGEQESRRDRAIAW
jgi:hypothetical protein